MQAQLQKPRRLVAIDAMNLLSRAFYGIPLAFDSANRPNNALRGWFNTWFLIQEKLAPDQIIAVFDGGRDEERLKALPQYKANRTQKPAEYMQQLDAAYWLCGAMGMLAYRKPGIEADDVLYTLSLAVPPEEELLVFSNDKDLTQCVQGRCRLVKPTQNNGRSGFEILDESRVVEHFGVRPEQMALYLAMVGDSSDNVPGVPQIGPKTAAKLIAQFPDHATLVHAPELGGNRWEALSTALKVTQLKVIAGIQWPPRVENSEVDCELLESFCRQRALYRVADKIELRMSHPSSTPAAASPAPGLTSGLRRQRPRPDEKQPSFVL
jgi:DNA polymerase-1